GPKRPVAEEDARDTARRRTRVKQDPLDRRRTRPERQKESNHDDEAGDGESPDEPNRMRQCRRAQLESRLTAEGCGRSRSGKGWDLRSASPLELYPHDVYDDEEQEQRREVLDEYRRR